MRFKIFSDPVHGFISVPKGLLLELIQTPELQRLRRIRQLGVGHLVFPGAEHTRFGHALGAMALMHDALQSLAEKGTPIGAEEHLSALAAALLHDIGHGPFSHTLEHTLISGFRHEQMSRRLLVRLNQKFAGALDLTLRIFDNAYERPFFHQLVSSQLDMDRLDYLRRDSFYTGVAEGGVGVDRIIKTLRVFPPSGGTESRIVVEAKGTYAVENYLLSRRVMYWQVYLHKTVISGDHLLLAALRRGTQLLNAGQLNGGVTSGPLKFFLENDLSSTDIESDSLVDQFCRIDDSDILYSLKQWCLADDAILSDLSRRFINRDFFRLAFLDEEPNQEQMANWKQQVSDWMKREGLRDPASPEVDTSFFLHCDRSTHLGYEPAADSIAVLDRWGGLHELSAAADTQAIHAISGQVAKPYVCYPKEVSLDGIEQSGLT
jgi:HD superfamily phosphohydrolase